MLGLHLRARIIILLSMALCLICQSASATSISISYTGTYEGFWSGNYPLGQAAMGNSGGGGSLGYGWFKLIFNFDSTLAEPGFFTPTSLSNIAYGLYTTPSVGSATLSPFGITVGDYYASDTAGPGYTTQFVSNLFFGKGGYFQTPTISMSASDPLMPASIVTPFKTSSSRPIGTGTEISEYEQSGFGGGYIEYALTAYSIDVVVDGVSAVPETSTWAMMLLGFCGLGLLLHRQRAVA